MASFHWKVRQENFIKKESILIKTEDHPLKNFVVTERIARKLSRSSTNNESIELKIPSQGLDDILDPLTKFALNDMDPLSKLQKDEVDVKIQEDKPKITPLQIWNNKKSFILNKYTTSNKISIVSSYLLEGDKIVVKNQNSVSDNVQNRLEQLDCYEESTKRKMELTQAEYVNKIDLLNKELVKAWDTEQRVKAVKIVIQCAKLLADTDVMSFYPSKFVLITEILDIFGHFVYDRLKQMAEKKIKNSNLTKLPEDFTPDLISDAAKETCSNWFHKIASIRELVPRLYVELAIIRSYNFLSVTEASESLIRITKMINGIGNPLVAMYARCYLCKVGQTLPSSRRNNSYIFENLQCIIQTYHHLFNQSIKKALRKEEISTHKYLTFFSPAIDYIVEILIIDAPDSLLDKILKLCMRKESSLILNTLISVFKPSYIACKTVEFLEMIGQCAIDGFPISTLLCSLGNALGKYPPPSEQRKPILKNIGQYTNSFQELDDYINYVEAWIPFIAKNFRVREINAILGNIISRISARKDCDNYINQLKNIMRIIVQNVEDYEAIFTMENFLPFLDLFQQESVRIEVCKMILINFQNDVKISDPIVINALSFICNILHDSVDALTPEDELRQIGLIICNVIRKVDYGRDFEQQLNFYVEARGSFSNIDSVLIDLVQKTNTLMIRTRDIMQGFHTRKTADFVRACAAYCYITIPSISSSKARLELYLLTSQVALFNLCLGQADACLRAAVATIPDYQEEHLKDEFFLVSYIKKFLSTLLITPDNPDLGVLSILKSLLNNLQQYEWDVNGTSLIVIYLSVLDVLSVMAQETLPYHVDKVESNDTLYGSDEKFIQEINKVCTIILVEILSRLKQMGSCRKQSALALDLFNRIMNRCDLNDLGIQKLASNLWQKCLKHNFIDIKLMESISLYYKCKGVTLNL